MESHSKIYVVCDPSQDPFLCSDSETDLTIAIKKARAQKRNVYSLPEECDEQTIPKLEFDFALFAEIETNNQNNKVASLQRVIELLKQELNTTGGKIFADATLKVMQETRAELGHTNDARSLKTTEFVNNLFDIEVATTEDEQYFLDLIESIQVLQVHFKNKGAK